MTRPDERAARDDMAAATGNDYAAELTRPIPIDEQREDFGPFRGLLAAVLLIVLGVAGSAAVVGVYRLVRAWAQAEGLL